MGYTERFAWFNSSEDAYRFVSLYQRMRFLSRGEASHFLAEVLTVNHDTDIEYSAYMYRDTDEEFYFDVEFSSLKEFESKVYLGTKKHHFKAGDTLLWFIGSRGGQSSPERLLGIDLRYQFDLRDAIIESHPELKDSDLLDDFIRIAEEQRCLQFLEEDDMRILDECVIMELDSIKDVDTLIKDSTFKHMNLFVDEGGRAEFIEDRGVLKLRNKEEERYYASLEDEK